MFSRDVKDIVGGSSLMLIGGFAAFHAATRLQIGTVSHMGPGMFPLAVGTLMAALGLVIFIAAFWRHGDGFDFDLRSLVAISLSVLIFGLMIRPFGLVPAIVALTLVASRADSKLSWWAAIAVAAALALLATLIFRIGLGMPVPIINWPW